MLLKMLINSNSKTYIQERVSLKYIYCNNHNLVYDNIGYNKY